MYIDLLFLLLLSLFLGFRLWDLLGKNAPKGPKNKKSNLFILPQDQVIIEKESRQETSFYPDFNESAFLSGAEKAFGQIEKALASRDLPSLQKLVDADFVPTLLKKYTAESDEAFTVCLLSLTIQDRSLEQGVAFVKVQFTYQRTQQNKIQTMEEVWTFKRALTSTTPNWLLIKID